MKRIRLQGRVSVSQLGSAAAGQPANLRPWIPFCQRCHSVRRSSTQAVAEKPVEDPVNSLDELASLKPTVIKGQKKLRYVELPANGAKLAALHARLQLSQRFPIGTLARTLVDPTANAGREDENRPNNKTLAALGEDLLGYYTAEHIICTYPRLPVEILWAAQAAYVGPSALEAIAKEWGVEPAAAPGHGVDPGYLQFREVKRTEAHYEPGFHGKRKQLMSAPDLLPMDWKAKRERAAAPSGWTKQENRERISFTYRIMKGDQFGNEPVKPATDERGLPITTLEQASAQFVRAILGAVHLHNGPLAAKQFFQNHFLSRSLDLTKMFRFERPQRDLMLLCNREGFESPVARLISETGRKSTHPVFVVGIFSGRDKLGEAVGGSLMEAKARASVVALKSWYLYSPLDVTVPSETTLPTNGKPWRPNVVDCGEVIS